MYEEGWCGGAATRSRKGKCLRSSSSSSEAGGSYRVPKHLDRKRGFRKMRNTTTMDELGMTELMSGSETLTWGSGDKYDGIWENGAPKGNGVFSWTKDQQRLDDLCCSGIGVSRGLYGISSVKGFPRICVWESDGDDGDITCEIVDNADLPVSYFDRQTSVVGNELMYFSPSCFSDESKKKKPGETIRKGHKNYELMRSLQLGVRYSVGKHASVCRELKSSDFDPYDNFWTKFPPEGSKITPAHQFLEFRWKDYCPKVFRHLRELFHVDPTGYIMSICGNGGLRELSSPGKSGSLFYMTQDDRFMIKTVKKSEVKVLIKMLPSYYQHVCQYQNSLVTKFLGVHCFKPIGGQKTRFIVMSNLFYSEYPIHERYDLKGSSHGRKTDKPDCEIDETTTRKDLDLNLVFFLSRYWFRELLKQIDIDCNFLEAEGIMDYSLLVGLHFRCDSSKNQRHSCKSEQHRIENFLPGFHFLEAEFDDLNHASRCRKQSVRLGANMPARAERITSAFARHSPGGAINVAPHSGESYDVILQFGIIDILQDYDISKKLEHAYKSFQADPASISAVDPKLYSRRFRDFIARIFAKDNRTHSAPICFPFSHVKDTLLQKLQEPASNT